MPSLRWYLKRKRLFRCLCALAPLLLLVIVPVLHVSPAADVGSLHWKTDRADELRRMYGQDVGFPARGKGDSSSLVNFSIDGPHVWLYRKRWVRDEYRQHGRFLIASLGGVGSSSIVMALRKPLRKLRSETNDLNNNDGLKHTTYSPLSRGAIAAFDPTIIVYVLGDPAAAIASHYRRGWPGTQFCLVNPEAESLLAADVRLFPTLMPPPKVNCFSNYTRLVDETRIDYFSAYEHAASWLGATELGYTVVWGTLSTLQRLNEEGAFGRLLNKSSTAPTPLYDFSFRNTSWSAEGKSPAFLDFYGKIYARLLEAFNGTCASPNPDLCTSVGLRPIQGAKRLNASTASAFRALRSHPKKIHIARRDYFSGLPGMCGPVLRPPPHRKGVKT